MTTENNGSERTPLMWSRVGLTVLALAMIGYLLLSGRPHTFNGIAMEPVEPAPDFTLINQDQQSVSLEDYRGQFVLLYFGFTNCPDECPITMAEWRRVYEMLGEDASQVEFLFISVDPERDTPERLREYLDHFNSSFVGLTGSLDDLEDIARSYSAYFVEIPVTSAAPTEGDSHDDMDMENGETHDHSEEYLVDHTTMIHLIDREGKLLRVYPYYETAESLASDLLYLVKQ